MKCGGHPGKRDTVIVSSSLLPKTVSLQKAGLSHLVTLVTLQKELTLKKEKMEGRFLFLEWHGKKNQEILQETIQ